MLCTGVEAWHTSGEAAAKSKGAMGATHGGKVLEQGQTDEADALGIGTDIRSGRDRQVGLGKLVRLPSILSEVIWPRCRWPPIRGTATRHGLQTSLDF
jgi:hypothetical protein